MKKLITLLLLGFCAFTNAQQKITFSYDSAGNQILRSLCLSGCSPTGKSTEEVKEMEAVTNDDLLKFAKEDVISYYPNPVKEQLYLKWELINDNKVSSITVYALSGQVLQNFSRTESTDNQVISFGDYPRGVYLVVLNYKDGDQKTIKIIKQ
ncbi:T9SS type A sorting domain-containing protein [Flavobacterium sharifuzzamanii]|uniref:T9SS type A sorting domain-containing protein n=1 Tax=Flavobacterium sharifuzzamanii TaxID=2211133 RepID=UPI000DABD972|nr:T9SS type A sorting domain-containing protein [Flavobacterium sharifuzzamanii]KAF2080631.1 T9SS type A sorting domain-containing protein [Flavobacterium sharifuzzamanii]